MHGYLDTGVLFYMPQGRTAFPSALPGKRLRVLSNLCCACNADWQQKRNFFGLPVEKFHQPLALWHPSGHYIIAVAAHGFVYVFHVGSAKVLSCPLHCSEQTA